MSLSYAFKNVKSSENLPLKDRSRPAIGEDETLRGVNSLDSVGNYFSVEPSS
jgi:hypothetical protein